MARIGTIFIKGKKHITGNLPDPNGIVNNTLDEDVDFSIDSEFKTYGLGYFSNLDSHQDPYQAYGGRILLEFNLISGEVSTFGLFFDITRRLNEESGTIKSGNKDFSSTSDDSFQKQVEMPNDDKHDGDEDTSTSNPTFYSYDVPSRGIIFNYLDSWDNTNSYSKWIGDFEEFVRVSFREFPYTPPAEMVLGSRCSNSTPWNHGRALVTRAQDGIRLSNTTNIQSPYIIELSGIK